MSRKMCKLVHHSRHTGTSASSMRINIDIALKIDTITLLDVYIFRKSSEVFFNSLFVLFCLCVKTQTLYKVKRCRIIRKIYFLELYVEKFFINNNTASTLICIRIRTVTSYSTQTSIAPNLTNSTVSESIIATSFSAALEGSMRF